MTISVKDVDASIGIRMNGSGNVDRFGDELDVEGRILGVRTGSVARKKNTRGRIDGSECARAGPGVLEVIIEAVGAGRGIERCYGFSLNGTSKDVAAAAADVVADTREIIPVKEFADPGNGPAIIGDGKTILVFLSVEQER
jgi:hypothetical protein